LSSVSFSCSMPESLAAPPGTSPIICCAPVSLRESSLMPMPAVPPALAMAHPRRAWVSACSVNRFVTARIAKNKKRNAPLRFVACARTSPTIGSSWRQQCEAMLFKRARKETKKTLTSFLWTTNHKNALPTRAHGARCRGPWPRGRVTGGCVLRFALGDTCCR